MQEKLVAIAPFLHFCPQVTTLGVKASISDYTPAQRKLMLSATNILFPTPRFARIFQAAGKLTFPSAFTYSVQRSRLIQETLLQVLDCPHPYTRIYYRRQKSSISRDFSFPFRAMGPWMHDGVRTVSNTGELRAACEIYNPLLIREALDYQELFRLVFINCRCVAIIKKTSGIDRWVAPESFSSRIVSCLEKLLEAAGINMIAAEIGLIRGDWRLIELGRPPLSWPTPDGDVFRFDLISRMIESKRFAVKGY